MIGKIKIDAIRDQGESRAENQDSHLVLRLEKEGLDGGVYVCAVADGVGSFVNSALASEFTIKNLKEWFEKKGCENILDMRFEVFREQLYNAVKDIHALLLDFAAKKGIEYGTTLTLLCIIHNSYIVIQVGDSRCYLYENHVIRQITRDQNLAEKKRLSGEMVTDDKDESTLLQCLGRGSMEPAIYDGILTDEYTFLVCSDGLSNTISHKDIADIIKVKAPCKDNLEVLLNKARRNGEEDNISGILLHHLA